MRACCRARSSSIDARAELVQMGSFGCGHDAYLTDEIARMMGEMAPRFR
ncbi:MAG: hypothetical protein ACLRM9_05230 [Collinsella aerofaciens]